VVVSGNDLRLCEQGKATAIYLPKPVQQVEIAGKTNELGMRRMKLPDPPYMVAEMSKDGSSVVGRAPHPKKSQLGLDTFIWTRQEGIRFFSDLLRKAKITLPQGYRVSDISALSRDGHVLVGFVTKRKYDPPNAFVLSVK
jgi:hypothetical protein